ncbi:MAG: ribose-phosphate diphosphokinase [Spirochaetia bacterium]|jgi:ribose-phosphate pyrophosphokinase|nr:ribose-phosphate diphosphokinase [Spirochaetia bacterium]
MSPTRPIKLGVISCPGTEKVTTEVVRHLKKQYSKKYSRLASHISRKYNMQVEEVWRMMYLNEDLHSVRLNQNSIYTKYQPPEFRLPVKFTRFANGEFKAEINSSVKGMNIFIIQDVENHYPINFNENSEGHILSVNDHIFLLFVTMDAVRQAGAASVTLVLPTYPYSRQHKKKGREALTASRFGQICEFMGANRIITIDIHSKEIENSFKNLILENLHGSYQVLLKLKKLVNFDDPDLVVVSPDTGAVDRNKFFAGNLNKPLAMLYKERDYSKVSHDAGKTNITNIRLLGDVKGKTVFMADDMLGTGGTLIIAMKALKDFGAKKIICSISLPIFSGDSISFFDKAYEEGLFEYIIGTTAVYHGKDLLDKEWFVSAPVSDLIARSISRLYHEKSLSPLLDNSRMIQKLIKN